MKMTNRFNLARFMDGHEARTRRNMRLSHIHLALDPEEKYVILAHLRGVTGWHKWDRTGKAEGTAFNNLEMVEEYPDLSTKVYEDRLKERVG